jgi:hypothetical protein
MRMNAHPITLSSAPLFLEALATTITTPITNRTIARIRFTVLLLSPATLENYHGEAVGRVMRLTAAPRRS